MIDKLTRAFAPESLDVIDESDEHAGHMGHHHGDHPQGGETHFRVYIVASAFAGVSRLQRHRLVNDVLADELANGVHALAIHADAPAKPATEGSATAFQG